MPGALQHLPREVIARSERFIELLGDVLHVGLLVEIQLELIILVPSLITNMEVGVEEPGQEVVGAGAGADAELIKNALILVQLAELRLQGLEDLDGLDGLVGLLDVPDFDVEEVSGEDVSPVLREGDIADGGHNLGEEVLVGGGLLLLEDHGGVVADARSPQISHFDDSFGGGEDEEVVLAWVELGGCDDLVELLEVVWLEVDDVEGHLSVLEVPEVDSEVV